MKSAKNKQGSPRAIVTRVVLLLAVLLLGNTQLVFAKPGKIESVKFSDHDNLARLTIELEKATQFTYFPLRNPNRTVVDLINVDPDFDLSNLKISGDKVTVVRHSTPKTPNSTRIVIETTKRLRTRAFMLEPYKDSVQSLGHRMVVEFVDPNPQKMAKVEPKPAPAKVEPKPAPAAKAIPKPAPVGKVEASKPEPTPQNEASARVEPVIPATRQAPVISLPTSSAPVVIEPVATIPVPTQTSPNLASRSLQESSPNNSSVPKRDKDIVIVIDPGHGGVDPGSIGPAGTYEKNITLSISKMLASRLNAEPGLRAVLTRESDYYISPNDRPKIAVREKADLMVSIHADAFTTPQPRGGSVWVLSKGRADSELGRLLEQTERSSELLGPAADVIDDRDTERYFAETILNMSMDLFRALSYELSNEIIKDMKDVTKMHKKTPQSASLAVLTAPETPSVLVEVGFISNPQEEKNLNWAKHRQRLAESLASSIKRYFKNTPPDGTTWAYEKYGLPATPNTHTVLRSETLFTLSKRYGVTVEDFKRVNNLSSNALSVGQVLVIPD
jgi:N-acetylmuramoyl-L-alanine amidase